MAIINTTDITTKDIDGTGVFDDLMVTVQVRLEEEFTKNRIQGTDYSKLYLGALTAVLQESIQFVLTKQTADKQADLLTAQILNETIKGTLLTAEIAKTNSEKLLLDQNISNALIQGANLTKQGLEIVAQTSLIGAQETKLTGVDTILVTAQTNKINSEKSLTDDEILKTIQETALLSQNTANALLTASIIPKQGNKLDTEKALLTQKIDSEKAQILDVINLLPVTGVIGKQKSLFSAQIAGFDRDAEQKLAKIAADAWAVEASIDNTVIRPVGITDIDVTNIMAKARAGIGVV